MKKNTMAVVVIGALAVACTGPAMEVAGDAMVAVGDAMRDVGDVGDAHAAPTVVEAECVQIGGGTVFRPNPDGSGVRQTQFRWYATVRESWIDPDRITTGHAVVCGRVTETVVEPVPPPCPAGATCTIEFPPSLDCVLAPVEVESGVARVSCGISLEVESLGAGGVRNTRSLTVDRRTRARFVLEH